MHETIQGKRKHSRVKLLLGCVTTIESSGSVSDEDSDLNRSIIFVLVIC